MLTGVQHPTDAVLMLLIDGEISALRAFRVRRHLKRCSGCRLRETRLREINNDLARFDVAGLNVENMGAEIPSSARARALLKARMDASAETRLIRHPVRAIASAAVVIAVSGGALFYAYGHTTTSADRQADLKILTEPDRSLTPGATRQVGLSDICNNPGDDLDPEVSPTIERRVLQEYGMDRAPVGTYQVDYLINPQLGGTDDIKNLWPEPYKSTEWNAHAKDALEVRLHQMVCYRQIDLASAQKEIATDWVAAYKKYFHSAEPM